jgi:hypothetical protein
VEAEAVKRSFEFNPSPLECAEEFATWSGDDQAAFFEHLGKLFAKWGKHRRDSQVYYIGERLRAWGVGRQFVADLADAFDDGAQRTTHATDHEKGK